MNAEWYVDWEYDDEGHTTGPWASMDAMLCHLASVAELRIYAGDAKRLKSITVRDEE